ncbi:hypothetical protein EMIT0P258_80196 [Pseudomonas sp. IT-P258]
MARQWADAGLVGFRSQFPCREAQIDQECLYSSTGCAKALRTES